MIKRFLPLALAAVTAFSAHASCLVPYFEQFASIPHVAESVAAADLDGDGKPDAITSTSAAIHVARNDGSGKLLTPVAVYEGSVAAGPLVHDFNGNGALDLAFASSSAITILPGNGNGTFATPVVSAATFTTPRLAAARFDQGNTLDVVVIDQASPLLVLFANSGTGAVTEKTRLTLRATPRALVAADFDADGSSDVLVSYSSGATFDLFYGRGDGTFDVRVVPGVAATATLRAADLNRDQLPDIAALASPGPLFLMRNLGSRTFGDPLTYTAVASAHSLDVADLTLDEIPDVFIAPRQSTCTFEVRTSSGLVSFSTGWTFNFRPFCHHPQPTTYAALADFDGDGRNDAVASIRESEASVMPSELAIYRNLCGDGQVLLKAAAPVISAGQAATFTVEVLQPKGQPYYYVGTGTVTLREGETIHGTATLSAGRASFTLPNLPAGEHTFVVAHEGDEMYAPSQSAPLTIRVTPETTTTAIAITPVNGEYGVAGTLKLQVTSSDGTTPSGSIQLYIDDNLQSTYSAPATTTWISAAVGTHTVRARYAGSPAHPPSSATITYVVEKQTPRIMLNPASGVAGRSTSTALHLASRSGSSGSAPTGTVTLSARGVVLGTKPAGSYTSFDLSTLGVGSHLLTASYPGDTNYAATEVTLSYVIFASSAVAIDARGDARQIVVTSSDTYSSMYRKQPATAWAHASHIGYGGSTAFDTSALPETLYQYGSLDHTRAASAVDIGMRIAFTDDPLRAGVAMKAVHLQELVRATNIVRTAAGLAPLSMNITSGTVISAAHINTVRAAIQQARTTLGANAFPFTDAITSGTAVRAAHVQELREAIR